MSESQRLHLGGHRQVLEIDEGEPVTTSDVVGARRDWIRRRAPWLAVAVVVAVLALVGAQTLFDVRARDRLAYLASVPGVLQPLPEHVSTLWGWTPADAVTLVADDTAGRWTIGTRYRQGAVELRGIDPDTGAHLWSTPFPIDDALPPEARGTFPSVWVRCATLPAARAVCGADLAGPGQVVGTPLMVLDPNDGSVISRRILPAGTLWAASDGLVVVARPVADDSTHTHWDVRATDPGTGARVWSDSTPSVAASEPLRIGSTTIDSETTLSADADRVLLAGDGHAWLWSPDGEPLTPHSVGPKGWTELGRSDTLAWTPFQSLAHPAGVLVTDRGKHVAVDGSQADLAVDDGSARNVVLLRNGQGGSVVVARDATTGRELWRAEGTTGPLMVLDGAVVTAGSTSVVSRDARSGDERWRAHVDATPVYLGADPLHVVVLTDDLQLRTLDLVDGRTAGTADVRSLLGGGYATLDDAEEHGGRLLLTFRDGSGLALG